MDITRIPDNLPDGFFSQEDILIYRALASKFLLDSGVMCELGNWQGRSICSISDIILETKTKVYTVDTFLGTEADELQDEIKSNCDIKQIFMDNIERFGIKENITPLVMTTSEACELVEDNSVNMIFIDADHSYQAVTQDLSNWYPKLKSKGIICGHDATWETVNNAVSDFFKGRYSAKYDIWYKLKGQ